MLQTENGERRERNEDGPKDAGPDAVSVSAEGWDHTMEHSGMILKKVQKKETGKGDGGDGANGAMFGR